MSKIIYKQDSGIVAIVDPVLTEKNPSTGVEYTIEEIAAKDVPTGKKYKIVDDSDVPTDRAFRDAWTVDDSDLTDGVGA
tara:strand:+ start:920 stop:1156 length:237 start_codon:yes stop_codon:yes gene_type:complete